MEEILQRLDRIERLTLIGVKNVLTIDETCCLTGLSKSFIYNLTMRKAIPHYRAVGVNRKRLYFKKDEIERWLTHNQFGAEVAEDIRDAANVNREWVISNIIHKNL